MDRTPSVGTKYAKQIKALREFTGQTLRAFGAECHVAYVSVSLWETGKGGPCREAWLHLLKMFQAKRIVELAEERGVWTDGHQQRLEHKMYIRGYSFIEAVNAALLNDYHPLWCAMLAEEQGKNGVGVPDVEASLHINDRNGHYFWRTIDCPWCEADHEYPAGHGPNVRHTIMPKPDPVTGQRIFPVPAADPTKALGLWVAGCKTDTVFNLVEVKTK